ncbi:Oxidoreductase molybdopterin binding domain protein [Pigmentiphaga humi]|uniref:Oxidoreductase molybdopterin binding domain protein n=1 Tax=Pigmentiphaga humi TaxID=2478468 RepID=A0A3P4AY05_9BURK|nr:molybdopterin-binding oxidoreductase [Pigmentiphaga humi]VCU68246.1 Oxidoreductase molybdopterin binding domain protein [Pigmentiphaga humi]
MNYSMLAKFGTAALLAAVLTACGGDGAIHENETAPSISLGGDLEHAASFTVDDLKTRTAVTQTVTYTSGNGSQTRTYTGANLWSLLEDAGIKTDPAYKNDVLRKYIVVGSSDGYRVVFSAGELKPDMGNRASIVAYAETRDGKSGPLSDTDGPFRVTSPGDVKGGRYASMATSVELKSPVSKQTGIGGGLSPTFTISGQVQQPLTLDLAALQAEPAVTRTQGAGNEYKGVDLWYLLNDVAGLKTAPGAKNPTLGMYVLATGSDGYQALISMAEIDPAFGGGNSLVAYAVNDQLLDINGMARLVVPGDGRASRSVSNLVNLEVFALSDGK